jgi:hypothetical protein
LPRGRSPQPEHLPVLSPDLQASRHPPAKQQPASENSHNRDYVEHGRQECSDDYAGDEDHAPPEHERRLDSVGDERKLWIFLGHKTRLDPKG